MSSQLEMSDEMLAELKAEGIDLVENLATLCAGLHVALQHQADVGAESVGELFRILHTLKGLSQMAGQARVMGALHKVEDFVAAVREGRAAFDRDDLDLLGDLQDVLEKSFTCLPGAVDPALLAVLERVGERYLARVAVQGAQQADAHLTAKDDAGAAAESHPRAPQAESDRKDASEVEVATEGPDPGSVQDTLAASDASADGMGEPLASDDEPVSYEATAAEMGLLDKFRTRPEGIFASVFPPGVHPTVGALKESESLDNLLRVGDVIALRAGEEGSLLLFAAELDAELLSSIVGNDVVTLPKNAEPCGSLPEPWCAFFFGVETEGNMEGTGAAAALSATTPAAAPAVPLVSATSVAQAPSVAPVTTAHAASARTHAPSHAGGGEGDHDAEDFDAKNLSAGAAADLPELDPEMLQDFVSNADELLEELGQAMLTLEANPQDKDAIDLIFRAAHTIKGTAGMFGFRAIERLCHVMENLFDRIRKGSVAINALMVDALLFGLDHLRAMFDELKKGASSELPINEALARLKAAESGVAYGKEGAAKGAATAASASNAAAAHGSANGSSSPSLPSSSFSLGPTSPTAPAPASDAASSRAAGASTLGGGSGGSSGGASSPPAKKDTDKKGETEKKAEGVGTIRVDLKRLDSLVNLVGELVIDRSRFARIEEELRAHEPGSELCNLMSESVLLFSRHMNEVQSIIMKVRMVPVGNAFYKFTRVVRDLSRQVEKEIDLVIEGGETELDKTLVEEIGDPLVHLIRNSVDHGVETPDVREASGKPRKGTIHLRAAQDGNMIVITVKDDGKGLQVDRIRQKAIANGLIKDNDQLSDKELYNLIFEPGFSTADKVTNISGRGVGMDVVKKNIVKLKGVIELDSAIGKGTSTTIKLPLTLAIIPSLMVGVAGENFAIPLVNVIETIRMDPAEVQRVGTSSFVKLRDQVIPLMRLSDAFNLHEMEERFWYRTEDAHATAGKPVRNALASRAGRAHTAKPRMIFVVVGVGEKRVGVVVDELLGQQEIVIKSLGRLMGRLSGVAGGCVLGNGRVALVLDAGEMIEDFTFKKPAPHAGTGQGGHGRAV